MFTSPFRATHQRKKTKYNRKGSTVRACIVAHTADGLLLRIQYKEGKGAEVVNKYQPISAERFQRDYKELN